MEAPTLPITGGCGCGAVRFEITEPLLGAGYCHCSRCRRRTGTGSSVSGRTAPGSFRVREGADHVRSWSPEGGAEKAFCGLCGSALFSRSTGDPPVIGVRLGALDDDPGVRPSHRQYVADAAPWLPVPDDGLPRHPGPRPTVP